MKPICVSCRLFYRPTKNGTAFIEGYPNTAGAWHPYKLWMGDLWECRGCGNKIIVGVGHEPIAEHYQPGFSNTVEKFDPLLQVNDC